MQPALKIVPNPVPSRDDVGTRLVSLRAEALAALKARDAIDNICSQAWCDAHKKAVAACLRATAEMERLAKDPRTRYGSWRTLADIELMALGYL